MALVVAINLYTIYPRITLLKLQGVRFTYYYYASMSYILLNSFLSWIAEMDNSIVWGIGIGFLCDIGLVLGIGIVNSILTVLVGIGIVM